VIDDGRKHSRGREEDRNIRCHVRRQCQLRELLQLSIGGDHHDIVRECEEELSSSGGRRGTVVGKTSDHGEGLGDCRWRSRCVVTDGERVRTLV